jgi:uncharacterized membrane protein
MLAEVDGIAVFSRWLHLSAVMIAVGGTFFLRVVLHPAAQAALGDDARQALRDRLLRRWARVVHVAILVIILSGTYNLVLLLPRHKPVPGQMPLYHVLLGPKLLLAGVLFFIAIAVTGRSRTFEGMRKRRPLWLAVNLVIAGLVVLLSNILKHIPPTPHP